MRTYFVKSDILTITMCLTLSDALAQIDQEFTFSSILRTLYAEPEVLVRVPLCNPASSTLHLTIAYILLERAVSQGALAILGIRLGDPTICSSKSILDTANCFSCNNMLLLRYSP